MSCSENFRIAIIGSGPVGKLLLSSVTQHPRIEYAQFESETLPLRPSYGYGIGPQVFKTLTKLNPALAAEFRKQCLISPVWMNFRHAGDESIDLPTVKAPQGEYGRLGREELMDLLDSFCPADVPIYYGKKLVAVTKTGGELKLAFEDGTEHRADAVWACDGMGSLCRQLIQGPDYERMAYSGSIAFRGKIPSHLVTEAIGEEYTQTQMFIGLKGFHVLTFPIAGGKLINIVAFSIEEVLKKRGRNYKTTTEELLGYFPGASKTLQTLLRLLNEQPEGCICLELMAMKHLGTFFNRDLCMTSFGDAANGMLPHIAGSMSTGFIGATTFLHDEFNPRIKSLAANAEKAEIAGALMDASAGYEREHRPLAQKLVDYSAEQADIWNGGVLDADVFSKRPRFLWETADER